MRRIFPMDLGRHVLVAGLALAGCRDASVEPSAEPPASVTSASTASAGARVPAPSASTSASTAPEPTGCAPFAIDPERATAIVRALPEVARQLESGKNRILV